MNSPERLISGQFTRLSISIKIDDAYMFSVPWLDNWSISETNEIVINEQIREIYNAKN